MTPSYVRNAVGECWPPLEICCDLLHPLSFTPDATNIHLRERLSFLASKSEGMLFRCVFISLLKATYFCR